MSTRRKKRRQKQVVQGFRDGKDYQRGAGCVDKLAFKYMEMCKVESSTDSESDTSPRWSDTSTKGCVSSTPEGKAICKIMTFVPKSAARYHLPSLDPYDGSSEDSGSSKCGPRGPRKGGCRVRSRGQRGAMSTAIISKEAGKGGAQSTMTVQLPLDVQMRSSSESEMRKGNFGVSSPRGYRGLSGVTPTDSGLHTDSSRCTPEVFACMGVTPVLLPDSPSHRTPYGTHPKSLNGPGPLEALPKRKSCLPGAESGERGLRKRQRVVDMEVGHFPL